MTAAEHRNSTVQPITTPPHFTKSADGENEGEILDWSRQVFCKCTTHFNPVFPLLSPHYITLHSKSGSPLLNI
ncbi:hypothetical protein DFA_07973 [Cavenderia fasciculata]|uniref:Uncharacterized protein n=1 Tax=Cavenderia fasciculata TaxID=261658 RepID=F4Q4D0_CACFS|nr:uncharacterized protein DFA_07973 [Cavenderia fasciculata]EGG16992.1 hypothetical protein DFA_07973 [Cavenderia fasciculata]|eukprot:XP_004355476.1 hypothetical protein DFA_07973 [Cavenderia fasciculata]